MKEFIVNNQPHRLFVGDRWDEMGKLQFDYCIEQGLAPEMKFIDIGCGCFRGGVHFIKYMGNNYYGIDRHQELIDAGIEVEAPEHGLSANRDNFFVTKDFDISSFNTMFDFGLCSSVFTHLPVPSIVECLLNVHPHFKAGAPLYATIYTTNEESYELKLLTFEDRREYINVGPIQLDEESYSGLKTFYFNQDSISSIFNSVRGMWDCKFLGSWNHPRGQQMLQFKKVL